MRDTSETAAGMTTPDSTQLTGAKRPVLADASRRFVALARFKGAAVSFGDPMTLDGARRQAQFMRDGAKAIGNTDRRVGVYELTEVERV